MTAKSDTFEEALQALRNTLNAAYHLAPAVVVTGIVLFVIIAYVSLFFIEILQGTIIFLIIIISVLVYSSSNNYGEAALALMAGMLAAFTVNWTWNKYVVFMAALLGFLFFILLIVSIRLAAKNESLYREAALYIDISRSHEIEKQLITISKAIPDKMLGPVEKADAIRILAFRKIPLESIQYMLETIQLFVGITRLDVKTITLFLVDLTRVMNIPLGPDYKNRIYYIFDLYRDASVSDEEFIQAFTYTKHFVVSGQIKQDEYQSSLISGLKKGLSPAEMNEYIKEQLTAKQS